MSEATLPAMKVGQRWTHCRVDGRHTDYVVHKVLKTKAMLFADHGSFTEMASVHIDRMTPEEWRCLDG